MLAPDKAVEILHLDLTYSYPARFDDLQDAIKMATEALEFCIKYQAMIIELGQTLRLGEDSQ